MNSLGLTLEERRFWSIAAIGALAAHAAIGALVLAWVRPAEPAMPEPVVLVELPPEASPAPAVSSQQAVTEPQPEVQPQHLQTPPLDIPPVRAPLPRNAITLPPQSAPQPAPQPIRQASSASAAAPVASQPLAVSPTGTGSGASTAPGNDPRARQQEQNYFALVSAHLNRRKVYPAEARQARQQGVVTVRFTVDRNGNVSSAAIKRSSGHAVLDQATLDLLQRVAPLPRMPGSMQKDSVTLSLPIDYSLRTS